MSRLVISALCNVVKTPLNRICNHSASMFTSSCTNNYKSFSSLSNIVKYDLVKPCSLLNRFQIQVVSLCNPTIQTRNVTKFSLRKGKRKSVKAVLSRFYRLDWGVWIRGKCGRQKKLYKKSHNRKRRLRQHVFCNATQSFLLDKMVTSYWRRPKYYIDDPYEPYHRREEFCFTRTKPVVPHNLDS